MILIGILKKLISILQLKSKFLSKIKNINYEAKNVGIYKEDTTK